MFLPLLKEGEQCREEEEKEEGKALGHDQQQSVEEHQQGHQSNDDEVKEHMQISQQHDHPSAHR